MARKRKARLWGGNGRRAGRPGFYARYSEYPDGVRVNRSEHFETLEAAETWVDQYNHEKNQRGGREIRSKGLSHAVREIRSKYLSNVAADFTRRQATISARSMLSYRGTLTLFELLDRPLLHLG